MTDTTVDTSSIGAAAADEGHFANYAPLTTTSITAVAAGGMIVNGAPVATNADLEALEARVAALEAHASALSTWVEKRFAAVQADIVGVEASVHQVAMKVAVQYSELRTLVTKGLVEVESKITSFTTAAKGGLATLKADVEADAKAVKTEAEGIWTKLFG